ncbi:MAG TPA: hypothetical protein VMS55_14670 [Myxococcota bacterium]|nr:hypothetical protein [Myxococcota bacterium]
MREQWSVNAAALEFNIDRRTITKWLSRSDVKPVSDGPNGPLYALRDLVGVLADANLLGIQERHGAWSRIYHSSKGARDFADQALRALRKRGLDPAAMRVVLEAVVEELYVVCEQAEAEMHGKELRRRNVSEFGAVSLPDAELKRVLRSLILESSVVRARRHRSSRPPQEPISEGALEAASEIRVGNGA